MKGTLGSLKDTFIIEPSVFDDHRGYFYEGFNISKIIDIIGREFSVKQLNFSKSTKGVLRGLHFQHPPFEQSKLISCNFGEILDVIVDLRVGSPTYAQHEMIKLSGENKTRFYVPAGFAHGFLVLSDTAEIMYAVDQNYSKEHDAGIAYNDPELSIKWGLTSEELIISEKDQVLPNLIELNNQFQYHG